MLPFFFVSLRVSGETCIFYSLIHCIIRSIQMLHHRAIHCVLLVLTAFAGVHAASPKPAWAPHAMVSSVEAMATQAGVDILRRGGNAVDAAAAVALALGVTEGYASGIGGGCFILIRMADGTTICIDGRETAPIRSSRLMYVPRDTSQTSTLSTEGLLAVATPGELAALELAVRTYGRLPFSEAFESAIALADTGFEISMRYARAIKTNSELLTRFPGSRAVFFDAQGNPKLFRDRLVQTDLSNTLRQIQAEGIEAFYEGKIAQILAAFMDSRGGYLTLEDLRNYKPVLRQPVTGTYRGYEVLSMPPPSSGGIHVIQILNLLESYNLGAYGAGSSDALHRIAGAMEVAFADRAEYLGDPDFVKIPATGLLNKDYAAQRRSFIDQPRREHLSKYGDPWPFSGEIDSTGQKHTTHFCVVDSFGNAVSVTATVNTPFGSGVIVPGLGFVLNNEMDDFVTWPGRPNYFGLVGNAANEIEPGKRPLSSMSPTIVLKDNKPFIVVGSMGGPRIITSVVLTLLNVLDFGMNIQEAIDAPRIHQQWVPDVLAMEPEHPADVQSALGLMGHNVKSQNRWSAVTAIMADTTYGGWWGGADSRVSGFATGH